MRIDRLLVYLRFARTRSVACKLIEGHTLRLNRKHVQRGNENIGIGDVLTIMLGNEVRLVEVVSLPERRASPGLAKSHYRELDRSG
jgi:ribosome-associated heat shock protein Hsp15